MKSSFASLMGFSFIMKLFDFSWRNSFFTRPGFLICHSLKMLPYAGHTSPVSPDISTWTDLSPLQYAWLHSHYLALYWSSLPLLCLVKPEHGIRKILESGVQSCNKLNSVVFFYYRYHYCCYYSRDYCYCYIATLPPRNFYDEFSLCSFGILSPRTLACPGDSSRRYALWKPTEI